MTDLDVLDRATSHVVIRWYCSGQKPNHLGDIAARVAAVYWGMKLGIPMDVWF